MIGRARNVAIFILAAGAAGGCGLTDVGKPLSVEITADPEAATVGDTISFRVAGTGSFISLLRIDYDDGTDPQDFGAGGSLEASTTFTHAYDGAGTYSVVGTNFDSSGQVSDTVEVVIDGG